MSKSKSQSINIEIGGAVNSSLGRAFKGVRDQQFALLQTLKNTRPQLQAAQAVNQYKTKLNELKAKQAQLSVQSPRMAKGIRELEGLYRKAKREAKGYGLSIGSIVKEEKRLERQLKRTSSALDRKNVLARNKNTRRDLQSEVVGTVGLAYAAAAPLRTAIDFEQSIAKLGAITQSSKSEMDKLSKSAKELGRTTQFGASEAAGAMTFLGMAGFKTNQILDATPGMLNLAQATGSELGTTADIASNILSGFKIEASDMSRVGDILAKATTTSNANLMELGDTMKYVAPAASAAGASIEEVTAMAGRLADAGIKGSAAGTALRSAYLRLVKPPGEAQKAIDQLGITIVNTNGQMRAMPDILKDIWSSTKDLGKAESLGLITQMFGTEASSAMVVLTDLAGSGAIGKYSKALHESTGISKKMAIQMGETTQGSLKRLGSAMEGMAITIGSLLLPTIAGLSEGLGWVFSKLSLLAEEFPLVTKFAVGLVVGLVALKVATLGTRFAVTLLSDAFILLKGGFAMLLRATPIVVAAIRTIGVAMASNPIGLLITGIAIAAGLIIANWEPISEFFSGLWGGIKTKFEGFQSWVTSWAKKVGNIIGKVFDNSPIGLLLRVGKEVGSWLSGSGDVVKAVAMGAAITAPTMSTPVFASNAANRSQTNVVHNNQQIKIYQQPGESTEELAQRIIQIQQEKAMRSEFDLF